MKFSLISIALCAASWAVAAPPSSNENSLSTREPLFSYSNILEKRKGGGGGGRGSGGSGAGGRGGSGGGYSGYSFSSTSNTGGRTRDGSGTPKQYGNYYTGGAQVPYTSGGRSPTRSIAPYALPIAAVAFFPGLWLFPVYAYGYPIGYRWTENGRNRTSNATCLCEEYSVCGCDPTDNSTFLTNVLTNGSTGGAPVNTSMVRTIDYNNGTIMSYINGTLDNGTTANGGTDPSNPDEVSPAAKAVIDYAGYWVMVVTVVLSVTLF